MSKGRLAGRVAAAALLLMICFALAFFTVSQSLARQQLAEYQGDLKTNLQRKAKQEYEYNQAQEALAAARAELAVQQPLADAAKAEDTALRAERKQLRAEIAPLREAYDAADHPEAWASLEEAAEAAISAQAGAAETLAEAEGLLPEGGQNGEGM